MTDLTGQKFGMLTALRCVGHFISGFNGRTWRRREPMWLCICDCGKEHLVRQGFLKRNLVKSCGCYKIKHPSHLTHGLANTRLYRTWCHMKGRCNNPTDAAYKYYGARGIKLCPEWENNALAFIEWALSCGSYSSELTIERIDVDKGYNPDNCTWVPQSEQCKNRRPFKCKHLNNERVSIKELAKDKGIPYKIVKNRLYDYGWSFEDALNIPVGQRRRNK